MYGLLQDGPCAGSHVQVDPNNPPQRIDVEAARYPYELAGVGGTPNPVATYFYAPPSTETPLDRPVEIYRPFTTAELRALKDFAEGARRLERMRFFDEVPQDISQTFSADGGMTSTMKEPDEEALRAALTELRQLYAQREPHSFHAVVNILKRSVHERGASAKQDALDALDRLKTNCNSAINSGIGMGLVIETPTKRHDARPRAILDAYFNGRYFHKDEGKAWLAARLDDLAPWGPYTFHVVLLRLRIMYSTAADVIERVLREPSLHAE